MPGGGGEEVGNGVMGGFVWCFGKGDEGTQCEGNGLVVEVGLSLDVVAGDVGDFERGGGVGFCGFEAFGEGDAVGLGGNVDAVGEGDLDVLGGEEDWVAVGGGKGEG